MPLHIVNMIDELIENGTDNDTKVLAAAGKETLLMLAEDREIRAKEKEKDRKNDVAFQKCIKSVTDCLDKHIVDQELHTAKGLLLNTRVLKWLLLGMVLVSGIMYYIPDFAKWIIGLF